MADKEEVIANLRAVLISRKDPATLYQLGRDYKELDGTIVPYKEFGFPSLEGFLRSDPTFKLYKQGNDTFVDVVPKKESRHISDMIAKQKSKTNKPRRTRPAPAFQPRALRSGSERNSRWAPNPAIWNIRSPARTSKSAQLYSGQPSRQITYTPHRSNGNQIRSSSVQHRLTTSQNPTPLQNTLRNSGSLQNSTNQLKAIENLATKVGPAKVQQSAKSVAQQPVPNFVDQLPVKSVAQKPLRNVAQKPARSIPQPKPLENSISKLSINNETPTNKVSRNPPIADATKKSAVRFEFPSSEEPKKIVPPHTNSKTESVYTPKVPDNNIFVKENHAGQDMTKKRILDLETVRSTSGRTVNVVPSNNLEYGNVQVTMSNDMVINNSFARPGVVKTSAQDRLNRIRQHQPAAAPILDIQPITIPKQSQQARLQKYRNQEIAQEAPPMNHQKTNEITSTPDSSEKNLVNEQLLKEFCDIKNLPLQEIKAYKHTIPQNAKIKSDRRSQVYGCTIKVGDEYTFGSYSDNFTTTEEAIDDAAKKALDALTKIYGTLEERNLPVTEGRLVPQRLLKIVAGHTNGKFLHQLPGEYREEYHENLPDDWLNHVHQSHLFNIKNSIGASQIIFVRAFDIPIANSASDSDDFVEPSPMMLPEQEGFWNVLITHVCSTVEVWVRILGDQYNGLYEGLQSEIEKDFLTKKVLVPNPQVGGYYAFCTTDCWLRVQVLEIKDREVLCFHIDTGEEEWHKFSEIYKLDVRYRYVPPQGVLLQLSRLQEYAENKYALKHLSELLYDKTLVAEIVKDECDGTDISVVLYDTYTDEDINLNACLLKMIKDEAKAPPLKEKGINEVYVSHVSDTGDVFVQIRNDSFEYLLTQIQIITDVGFGNDHLDDSKFLYTKSMDKLYLSVNVEENKCYRVSVTGPPVRDQVPVFFVDYGYSGWKEMSTLLAIDKLSSAIDDYPHQAVKVKLNGMATFTSAIASRLRGCLPVDQAVLLKVIQPGPVPVVEIFMRTQNDLLISVNNALQNEIEIERNAEEVECRPLPTKHVERAPFMPRASRYKPLPPSPETQKQTPTSLPEPKIPCDGSFFPIMVTMAASPANFVIQPCKDETVLKTMMNDLQSLCKNSPSPRPSHSDIKKGNVYAGKHNDGKWYRVQVTNVMTNNSVTVHFCDYGDYDVMSSRNLQRLTDPFLKIPYYAVRARLAGISSHEWSVTDCLTFQKLVCDKVFVSIIRNIVTDELNPSDKIVNITLIDSENGEDRYITPELIREINS